MPPGAKIAKTYLTRGGLLAIELQKFIRRFLSLPAKAQALLAIWIMHTHVFDEFEFTPYLNIVSPEPGCGKTTAGDVLSAFCCRATSPTSGSAAVLRRKIATDKPTLIIDEWDSMDHTVRKSCLNFLNTGFRSDGTYSVVAGSKIVEMSTFCPKAIVGRSVVALPDATFSRCISLTMQKALPGENLEKFRAPQREAAALLRQQCEQWAAGFRAKKVRVAPVMPESLTHRQADISEPVLVIADDCRGPWPLLIREALLNLFSERQIPTPENELLRAVQRFTAERSGKFFISQAFCAWANEQEETPWSDRPLTPAKLAGMLKIYDIFPTQINRVISGKQKNGRGYFVPQFRDALARYVDAPSSGR